MNKKTLDVTIRPATVEDSDAMFDVLVAAHSVGYDEMISKRLLPRFRRRYAATDKNRASFKRILRSRLDSERWTIYVAEVKGAIVGYHGAKDIEDPVLLRGLFVDPKFQGRGIGKQLFAAIIDHFKGVTFEFKVIKSNDRAIALYESFGFEQTRRLTSRFYGAPQITMVRRARG